MFDSGWERDLVPAPARGRAWSTEAPGPRLAAELAAHAAVDPLDDGYDAVERLGAYEHLAAWACAHQVDVAAALARTRQGHEGRDHSGRSLQRESELFSATAMEYAAMVQVAPVTGEHRLHQAVSLVERLPITLERLRGGRIAYSHARQLLEQTQDCTDVAARAVDARFWAEDRCRSRTPTQVRQRARRVVQRLDPDALRRRRERAVAERGLRYWADDDGATGVIQVRLPAETARGVYAVLDATARAAPDPPDTPPDQRRTLTARRADVLTDCVLGAATAHRGGGDTTPLETDAGTPADDTPADDTPADDTPADEARSDAVPAECAACGCRPGPSTPAVHTEVRVLIPWRTLAGLGEEPGEVEGHGPVPADTARAMAAGAMNGHPHPESSVLRRMLTDPVTGTARHLDLHRYRPPPSLAEFVYDRDQHCAAPGCRRSASTCDLDHVIAYDHTDPGGAGGPGRTHPDNLRPHCRRHHNIKTRGRWRVEPRPDTCEPAVVWISPSGHRWVVRSPALAEPDPDDPPPTRAPTRRHPDVVEHDGLLERRWG